jgi:hypothetical protein
VHRREHPIARQEVDSGGGDGPYAEAKESLAGYWLVDVEDEARRLEIASKVVAFTQEPLEVRQVADAPPEV